MNPFKNKHILAAVIITPILALISFFATDYFVSETPHAAEEGGLYKLVARPNCRYTSGVCTLKNGDFLLDISFLNNTVTVNSKLPLQGVKVGIGENTPINLSSNNENQQLWSATIGKPKTEDTFKLVAQLNDAVYYAEQALGFINKETLTDNKSEVTY